MATVKEIPPRKKEPSFKKVAAYCRVSTKTQKQLDSLVAQENYYEDKINANPDWQFAGIYSDVGSGTTIKGRKRLNALISACRRGKVDMVLIKSASRFARNTVDALKTIRMFRRWNVDIYFEKEDIKWGLQKSFVDPDSKYYQRKCYGYRHNEKGQLVINENEAEVVKLIFRMSKEGASLSKIAQTLQDQGILSPRGKAVWSRETLRKILHNEKYRGIVVLQKTFVANCLNHRQVKNIGQCDQYQIISNHKPIRPKIAHDLILFQTTGVVLYTIDKYFLVQFLDAYSPQYLLEISNCGGQCYVKFKRKNRLYQQLLICIRK